MKKSLIVLLIIIACVFIVGCPVSDTVAFCPYCGSRAIQTADPGVYQCQRIDCGKKFGAMEIPESER